MTETNIHISTVENYRDTQPQARAMHPDDFEKMLHELANITGPKDGPGFLAYYSMARAKEAHTQQHLRRSR